MILLVRHAKAGSRETWPGDDRLRPLTAGGRYQARGLPALLEPFPMSRILSSDYVRCVQTVEPLAAARQLRVETAAELAEGGVAARLVPLMAELAAEGAVMCSHGDVIGDVVSGLEQAGLTPRGHARWEKGSVWALDFTGGTISSARYLPPPG